MKRKKTIIILSILVLVFALLVCGWFFAYHHTKNTDNLPALNVLQESDLENLVGYQRAQLISVWGEPDDTIDVHQDVWDCPGTEDIFVTYGPDGKVKEAVFLVE